MDPGGNSNLGPWARILAARSAMLFTGLDWNYFINFYFFLLGGAGGVSIGVQVDICKSSSSPSLRRRLADKADLYSDIENVVSNDVVTSRHKKEPRRRGFSHDHTLGEEKQSYAWRQVLLNLLTYFCHATLEFR